MSDDILKKLETRVNRRSFLRGSSLAAAALVGAAALPLGLAAQQSAGQAPQDQKQDQKQGQKDGDGAKDKDKDAGKNGDDSAEGKSREDPNKLTLKDDSGRDNRICPQCGGTMYRQDDTWTCESCGYSYTE